MAGWQASDRVRAQLERAASAHAGVTECEGDLDRGKRKPVASTLQKGEAETRDEHFGK